MLGLRAPVGLKAHLVECLGKRAAAERHEQWAAKGEAGGGAKDGAAVETIGSASHGSGLHGYTAIVEGPRQIFPDRNAGGSKRPDRWHQRFPPRGCGRQ